jgi:hypothetical protein
LQYEKQRLNNQALKAHVDRADDYVDQDIERKKAESNIDLEKQRLGNKSLKNDIEANKNNQNLQYEKQRLNNQTLKAQVERADDYIDQDIERKKAENDVIKSGADARRNTSEGEKDLFTGVGRGIERHGLGK